MEHFFQIPVIHANQAHVFNARLVTFGYVYKFYVVIDNNEYEFERDEEHNYRVLSTVDILGEQVDPKLIDSIVEALEKYMA